MMPARVAVIPTLKASQYLQQLCKHWSHKFPVSYDALHGEIMFPNAKGVFEARDNSLYIVLTSDEEDVLSRMEGVVAEHLQRFAFREPLIICWENDIAGGLDVESVL